MDQPLSLYSLRREYQSSPLLEENMTSDPIEQFQIWFEEALQAQVLEPNAMVLATASLQGVPSCRTVLLKQCDTEGFVFFTNYESRKGCEIFANPHVSFTLFWKELERQIVVDGNARPVTAEESDHYFSQRPRGSQLGAWVALQQGEVIAHRHQLDAAYQHLERLYQDREVPRPPHWGGYRIIPQQMEFWQGRPNRLHDRLRYSLVAGHWKLERINP